MTTSSSNPATRSPLCPCLQWVAASVAGSGCFETPSSPALSGNPESKQQVSGCPTCDVCGNWHLRLQSLQVALVSTEGALNLPGNQYCLTCSPPTPLASRLPHVRTGRARRSWHGPGLHCPAEEPRGCGLSELTQVPAPVSQGLCTIPPGLLSALL